MSTDPQEVLLALGPARDQGDRPTCLSFAMSDMHRKAIELQEHLSPESLHRAAAARAGTPSNEAVPIDAAIATLEHNGQTTELAWPYHSPACLDHSAILHKHAGSGLAFDPSAILSSLKQGRPVVLVIFIGEEFFVQAGGEALEASDIMPIEACHAVLISGSRIVSGVTYFRLRNSWGSGWGDHGHAWASTEYILARSPSMMRLD